MQIRKPIYFLILLPIFIFLIFPVVSLSNPLFGQGTQTPSATTSQEFFKAPEKFNKVDRNKNKIMDHLEGLIGPAVATDRFDVLVMLNKPLTLLPTLKARHGDFITKFEYSSINGFATNLTKGQIIALSKDVDVKLVEFDALAFPHLDSAQNWFGTAKARADFSLDGDAAGDGAKTYSKDDVVIAILDTGIDPNHVDLDGGKIIAWRDATINNDQSGPYDELEDCAGHGSHVSSIAAGEGDGDANFIGVAPGAALVGVKVLSNRDVTIQNQTVELCTAATSEIVSGVQWIIANKDTYGIDIGNMSLGTSVCSDGNDMLSTVVNSAVNAGIAMFTSAGNSGPGPCTIGSPAAAEKVVTVGAMADVTPMTTSVSFGCGPAPFRGFYLVCFSSRGETIDGRIKPDIAAPGVFIKAASAFSGNDYKTFSGTSMASPFAAGVAALILDAHPNHTPAQVKSTIESTASDWGPAGKDVDYGAGRLQAYEAIKLAGSFSGTGPMVPSHTFTADSLSNRNRQDSWDIVVTDPSLPIAITMIMPDWERFDKPDFDMRLRDPNGTEIATSISATRQETIGIQPALAGIYQLEVYIFRSNGPYFFDVSFGEAAIAILLNTDGTTPFGAIALGQTIDTTASGTDDVQTIQVLAGPADLNIKSTNFSDGANTWFLNTTNGADQVLWEFSEDGLLWNPFTSSGTLFPYGNVAQGATKDIYFRLTLPNTTSSNKEHSATVTIVATEP
ncbi:S8 family serine peptidase [Patescibacteria group bacterium]|nr:S8 family serine peptidase [Patescibacteria group bacterium]